MSAVIAITAVGFGLMDKSSRGHYDTLKPISWDSKQVCLESESKTNNEDDDACV